MSKQTEPPMDSSLITLYCIANNVIKYIKSSGGIDKPQSIDPLDAVIDETQNDELFIKLETLGVGDKDLSNDDCFLLLVQRINNNYENDPVGFLRTFCSINNIQDSMAEQLISSANQLIKDKLGEYIIVESIWRLYSSKYYVETSILSLLFIVQGNNMASLLFFLGGCLKSLGDTNNAATLLRLSLRFDPNNLGALLNLAAIELKNKNYLSVVNYCEKIDKIDNGKISQDAQFLWGSASRELHNMDDAVVHFNKSRFPNSDNDLRLQKIAIDNGVPAFFGVCMPKSAGTYITNSISKMLNIPSIYYGTQHPLDYFNFYIIEHWLDRFLQGGAIAHTHMPPDYRHIEILKRHNIKKFWVHVRDPRDYIVSAYWHLLGHNQGSDQLGDYRRSNMLREKEYFLTTHGYDPKGQIDVDMIIKHLYPLMCTWIDGWVAWSKELECEVLFTTHSSLRMSPEQFFSEIFRYFGVPADLLIGLSPPEPGDSDRFRKGGSGEWRDVLNSQQQGTANLLITENIAQVCNL